MLWLPLAAELQWVTQVGWADASASEVGMRYAELLHSALGPLGGVADYVNMLDTAQGGCCCRCMCNMCTSATFSHCVPVLTSMHVAVCPSFAMDMLHVPTLRQDQFDC